MNTKTFHKVETNEVDDVPQHTLADVTPKLEKIWFKYPWLFQLNISHLLGGILAQVTSGYDGSMMNNLQTILRKSYRKSLRYHDKWCIYSI